MGPQHRAVAADWLRCSNIEFVAAPNVRTASKLLRAGGFDVVVTDMRLPDGTWCSLLSHVRKEQLLVCADRHDQILCGEVVGRGGYYSPTPPHEWVRLEELIRTRFQHRPAGSFSPLARAVSASA